MDPEFSWATFYEYVSGRSPRPLLIEVVEQFEREPREQILKAIDLGCGDGTETAYLLARGWQVLAIDSEPVAFERLLEKAPVEVRDRLQTQVVAFEEVELEPADLIHAGYSLPFCPPQHFNALWKKVTGNIEVGGRFAGQLFGVHDTWAKYEDKTFFDAERARALFVGFDIEHWEEIEEDGQSGEGPKHWHLFHIIAKKQA